MEQINNLILKDPNIFPDETVLQNALGDTFLIYQDLLKLCDKYKLICEWRYYNDGKAWLAKISFKKKTLIWMSVWTGFIKATIYFPEKYSEGIYSLDIADSLKLAFKLCKNVGKSKPCSFDLNSQAVLIDLEKVMNYKLSLK